MDTDTMAVLVLGGLAAIYYFRNMNTSKPDTEAINEVASFETDQQLTLLTGGDVSSEALPLNDDLADF